MRSVLAAVAAAIIAIGACTSTSGLTGGDDDAGSDGGSTDTGGPDGSKAEGVDSGADVQTPFVSKYRAAVLADAPIAYYRLGETVGSVAANEVGADGGIPGASYFGVTLGVPGAIEGDPDRAVDLKGAGRIFVDDPRLAFDLKKPFTLEAWVRPSTISMTYSRLFSREGVGTFPAGGYNVHIQNTSVSLNRMTDSGSNDSAEFNGTLELGVWSHVVATFDGTDMKLYVNASLEGTSQAAVRDEGLVDMPLTIGADSKFNASRLDAVVDEIAVYDHPLAPARVTAHYQAGTAK